MTFLKITFLCLLIPVASSVLTGCAQDDPRKQGGTYTAARHNAIGSNIPQPTDVDNTNSVAGGGAIPSYGPQVQTNRSGLPGGATR